MRDSDGKHLHLLHAEENLVAQSARFGISLEGTTVYTTMFPCSHCAAVLVSAGVVRVIYQDFKYGEKGQAEYVLRKAEVEYCKISEVV